MVVRDGLTCAAVYSRMRAGNNSRHRSSIGEYRYVTGFSPWSHVLFFLEVDHLGTEAVEAVILPGPPPRISRRVISASGRAP